MLLQALGTRLALLEHYRDSMAWEKLFAGFQGRGRAPASRCRARGLIPAPAPKTPGGIRPHQWFAKDPAFDDLVQRRFLRLIRQAIGGELDSWSAELSRALAVQDEAVTFRKVVTPWLPFRRP
jgi:AcrR family transcriptional regulator